MTRHITPHWLCYNNTSTRIVMTEIQTGDCPNVQTILLEHATPLYKDMGYQVNDDRLQISRSRLSIIVFNNASCWPAESAHYNDVIMSAIGSQITSLTIVYSTAYSGADQRKHQSSTLLAFMRGIHRSPVNSPHKVPVTRKLFPFDDVIMPQQNIVLKHLLHHLW